MFCFFFSEETSSTAQLLSIFFSLGSQENHSVDRVERFMHDRDVNEVMTDDIVHWACATREILARAAEGLDLATGEPLASLNSSNKHGPSTSSPTPLE